MTCTTKLDLLALIPEVEPVPLSSLTWPIAFALAILSTVPPLRKVIKNNTMKFIPFLSLLRRQTLNLELPNSNTTSFSRRTDPCFWNPHEERSSRAFNQQNKCI